VPGCLDRKSWDRLLLCINCQLNLQMMIKLNWSKILSE
jgi:hypothetical protein